MEKQRKAALFISIFMSLIVSGCSQSGWPSGRTMPDIENQDVTVSENQTPAQAVGQDLQQRPEISDSRYNYVVVISGQDVCLPYENFTFSEFTQTDAFGKEQTVNACGRWLRVQDVEDIPAVPYSGNMEIQVKGTLSRILYSLYDEAYEPKTGGEVEADSISAISLPEEPDPYYVKLVLSFEEANAVSGYQYFFQVLPDSTKKNSQDYPVTAVGELTESGGSPKLHLKLENNSTQDFFYDDNSPILFRQDGSRLREVTQKPGVTLAQTMQTLTAGGTAESNEQLGFLYGILEPGTYRFYKKLTAAESNELLMVYVEFSIP